MFYQFNHLGSPDYIKTEHGENFSFPPHLHQCFEVIIILEGEMNVTVDSRQYSLCAGQGCFIFPNQIHSLESTFSRHVLCIFSPDLVRAYSTRTSRLQPKSNLFKPDKYLSDYLEKLDNCANLSQKKGILYMLCGEFDRLTEYLPCRSDGEKLLSKIFSFVEEEFQSDCSLYTLSKKTGYDYAYLSRTFKKATKISFNSYVNFYRLSHACYLLSNTDYPILRVSLESGYRSLRSFNRNFKAHFGITPLQYKTNDK